MITSVATGTIAFDQVEIDHVICEQALIDCPADERSGSFIALGWYDAAEAGQTVAVRSRMEESPGSRERDAG